MIATNAARRLCESVFRFFILRYLRIGPLVVSFVSVGYEDRLLGRGMDVYPHLSAYLDFPSPDLALFNPGPQNTIGRLRLGLMVSGLNRPTDA